MSQSLVILGRQPAIGLAELESLYNAENLKLVGSGAVSIDVPHGDVAFNRLGGAMKLAKILTVINATDWQEIEDYLVKHLPDHVCCIAEGKLTLGLSASGFNINPKRINTTGLVLKKVVKATDRSCRIVPNKSAELSSAQVLHNKLFTSHNWELLLVRDGKQTYLAQTTNVQDIEAYGARDQARPMRDAKIGMLPPKLAQTLINLANPSESSTVLDPFCGTGVVLQEALLMGFNAYGTDIDERMVEYSQANLDWLVRTYVNQMPNSSQDLTISSKYSFNVGDATSFSWQAFDSIASETYLGRPFSAPPAQEVLRKVMSDVDAIHKKFLQNVASQTKSGFRMCLAVPAWRTKYGFTHLKMLDNLGDLGYTRAVFKTAGTGDMIYHRPDQVVGRELVVLIRK